MELGLTRKPDLLQVVLAGCAEAAAAARASERPTICPWVETAQRPTPTRKSGNTQLHEAPSCFEAEVIEEDRAHSGLQTHGHVGLGPHGANGQRRCDPRCFPVSASHPRTERRGRHLNRHSWQKKSAAECAVFLFTGGVHNSQEANITLGRTLGKCHLATGASQEKTPRARGALRGRCPGMPEHSNPRARDSEVLSALGLPPSHLPQSSLAAPEAVYCRSCG